MEAAPAAAVINKRKRRRAAKNCWNNHLPGDEDGKQGSTGVLSWQMLRAIKDWTRPQTPGRAVGTRFLLPLIPGGGGDEGPRALISGRMVNRTMKDKEGNLFPRVADWFPTPPSHVYWQKSTTEMH